VRFAEEQRGPQAASISGLHFDRTAPRFSGPEVAYVRQGDTNPRHWAAPTPMCELTINAGSNNQRSGCPKLVSNRRARYDTKNGRLRCSWFSASLEQPRHENELVGDGRLVV
jgi:hypothetical protein